MYTNLDALQQQLDILKQQQAASAALQQSPSNQFFPNQQPAAPQNINYQEIIQKTVQEELSKLLTTQIPALNQPVPQPVAPATPTSALEKQINDFAVTVLSPEQLSWISNPAVVSCAPMFFKTTKGKDALQLLVEEFKSYVEGK